jgi:hypothetical protein
LVIQLGAYSLRAQGSFREPAKAGPAFGHTYIGIEAGATRNSLITDISNRSYTQNEAGAGYLIGLSIRYEHRRWLSFQTGLNLSQKNYTMARTDSFSGIYDTHINSYLQSPLVTSLRLGGEQWGCFADLGLYGAYWISARVKGNVPGILNINDSIGLGGQIIEYFRLISYNENYHFDNRKDNRLEFGWLTGIGADYRLGGRYRVFVEARYYQSLTDQQKRYAIDQVSEVNQTWHFLAGCTLGLANKRCIQKRYKQ